jgi:hypothetical protein
MKPSSKAFLFSLPFAAVYLGSQFLPVSPCEFLHEKTYNLEGVVDYCGPGDSAFVDLTTRKWPLNLDFRPVGQLSPGKPCDFRLDIKQFDGSPLTAAEVALSHTKKIHLLAVDESLSDYHHLHPEPDSLYDGVWHFSLTPENAGKYVVFLDFIPIRSPRRVLLASSFQVDGKSILDEPSNENLVFSSEKRRFELSKVSEGFEDGDVGLVLRATDEEGRALNLRPVMGAFAHMVAFDPALKGFAHLHPEENLLPVKESDSHQGALTFSFSPPSDGLYRLWAQVRIGEEAESYIPFDLKVGS